MKYILGIESSCDDTAIALVSEDGTIVCNRVSSQEEVHAGYGGVVPELASRAHLSNFPTVYHAAMEEAQIDREKIAAVAVTFGPGLMGCLMVGVNFAKGLAMGWQVPLLGVNHIRGHVAAAFLESPPPALPALALIVSGGHSHLFGIRKPGHLTLLTKTRDDAAGEAFDKLSKMLGLGFPGGAIVDRLAEEGDDKAYALPQPKFRDGSNDFSFSGLKTAAMRHIQATPGSFRDPQGVAVKNLCASFRAAVIKQLMARMNLALEKHRDFKSVILGGGVACNRQLRRTVAQWAQESGLQAVITQPNLCSDNGAMIAWEGWRLFSQQKSSLAPDYALGPDITTKPFDQVALL